jgi:hypothetical protein
MAVDTALGAAGADTWIGVETLAVDGGLAAVGVLLADGTGAPQASSKPPNVVRAVIWMKARRLRSAEV